MKNAICAALITSMLLSISGCNNVADKKKILDYGKIEQGTYANNFFGVHLNIPDRWVVQSQKQTDDLVEQGNEVVRQNNESLGKQIDLSMQQTVYLLSVFKDSVGSVTSFNPSFMLLAEKLPVAASLMDAQGYLSQTRKALKATGQYADVKDQVFKKQIGGLEFYTLDAVIEMEDFTINQQFIATIKDGYALVFIVTSAGPEDEKELQSVITSVKFSS